MAVKSCLNKKPSVELSQTIEFLKIISEENRLKILSLLTKNEQCVCDIWQCLGLAQNLTSHHLQVLKKFGLVTSKKTGLKVIYSINHKVAQKYLTLLKRYFNASGA
jgi:ArsR family transcriptional regulator